MSLPSENISAVLRRGGGWRGIRAGRYWGMSMLMQATGRYWFGGGLKHHRFVRDGVCAPKGFDEQLC